MILTIYKEPDVRYDTPGKEAGVKNDFLRIEI